MLSAPLLVIANVLTASLLVIANVLTESLLVVANVHVPEQPHKRPDYERRLHGPPYPRVELAQDRALRGWGFRVETRDTLAPTRRHAPGPPPSSVWHSTHLQDLHEPRRRISARDAGKCCDGQ
jgi:hypothetical protein